MRSTLTISEALAKTKLKIHDTRKSLERIFEALENLHSPKKGRQQPANLPKECKVLFKDGEHLVAVWRDIVIVTWGGQTQANHVKNLHRLLKVLSRETNKPIALAQLLHDSIENLADDARDAFYHLLTDGEIAIKCSAVVFEGSGFRAATFRSIITSLSAFLRLSFPHVAFKQISQMSWWVAEQMRNTTELPHLSEQLANQLEAVICQLRQPNIPTHSN